MPKADDLQLHSLAMDLLQIVLQRTELDVLLRNRIRNAFLVRLLSSIQRSQPLLQNKLLHALHATFTAKVVATKIDARPSSNHQSLQDPDDFEDVNGQLLRHVLLQAISTQKDGAVIHQWVDFLFLSVSYFQASLDTLVFPLVIATVHRLQSLVNELQECFDPRRKGKNIATGANDLDFAAFVGLLERLMVFALEDRKHEHMPSSSPKPEKPSSSETGTGFLTYMSGVLGSPDPLALKPSDELVRVSHWPLNHIADEHTSFSRVHQSSSISTTPLLF